MLRHRPGRPEARAGRLAAMASLLSVLLAASTAGAQITVAKRLADLVAEGEQILVGTVTAVQSSRPPGSLIVTDVTFAVDRVLKGDVPDPFALRHLGGTVNGVTLTVRGAPEFEVSRRYLVFVRGNGRAGVPLVGGEQGLFRVVTPSGGGVDLVRTARGGALTNAAVLALTAPPAAALAAPAAPLTLPVFLDAIAGEMAR